MQTAEKISSAKSIRKVDAKDYDLVILGGGTGSTVAAWTFASEGKHVAVVNRKYIGGSCPNIACLPSKNIIHSAKVASYIRRSNEFGIAHDGFTVDMAGVRERKREMVPSITDYKLPFGSVLRMDSILLLVILSLIQATMPIAIGNTIFRTATILLQGDQTRVMI